MLFSSTVFILRFLPVFLIVYYIAPKKFRNYVLLLGSLIFYAIGEPVYIFLLMLSVGLNYYFARKIETFSVESKDTNEAGQRKKWFLLGLFYNIGLLIFFKYMDFFIENINTLIRLGSEKADSAFQLPLLKLSLPLGISFFTFELLAYLINVYNKKTIAEKSLIKFGTYVCMFPQLLSGPIVIYDDIREAIDNRKYSVVLIEDGFKLFIIGLGYKVLLANKLSSVWTEIQTIGFTSISTSLAWIGAFSYSLQLYFDFAGYSLMAIGVGKMLGFKIPKNFNQPYSAKSVTDFWRRWHMTLTAWFREYIYIPLGGNRKGKIRTIFNMLVVWLITGFWHGANWNFILWGFVLFLFMVTEKLFLKKYLDKSRILSRIYIVIVIPFTWILFAITNLSDLLVYVRRMFSFGFNYGNHYVFQNDFIYFGKSYGLLLLIAILMATPYPAKLYKKIRNNIFGILLLFVVFWMCIYQISIASNNPFMYFRF